MQPLISWQPSTLACAPHPDWMIWWMTSLSSGVVARTASFMATLRVASIPRLSLTATCTSSWLQIQYLTAASNACEPPAMCAGLSILVNNLKGMND